jgi:hypothetical protein
LVRATGYSVPHGISDGYNGNPPPPLTADYVKEAATSDVLEIDPARSLCGFLKK